MGCSNTRPVSGGSRCVKGKKKAAAHSEEDILKMIESKNWTKLSKAFNDSPDLVVSLLADADTLRKVVRSNDADLLRILKDRLPASALSKTDSSGKTVLMTICSEPGATVDAVSIFATKEDLELKDNEGETCFSKAAMRGNVEVLKVLCSMGSNPNSRNQCGETALFLAVEGDHREAVKYLLSIPVNVDIVDDFGKTALALAKEEHPDLVELFTSNK
eukprot:TRINITY_DN27552_c0_g1_i1.p1 TRINITY_DN27552_c0_g1~~TRINITY_DN27552_c0_g1_i1.p1  ORF type:complete len:217 (+),score=56.06 TRINITY_DN27552_c0_g1_i1:45-695(+)